MPSAGPDRFAIGASKVLRVISLVCRVAAWALVALVVADAVLTGSPRVLLLGVNGVVTRLIPSPLSGAFVFQTAFGGAFRGDFAIAAILLLVVDWVFGRLSTSLR